MAEFGTTCCYYIRFNTLQNETQLKLKENTSNGEYVEETENLNLNDNEQNENNNDKENKKKKTSNKKTSNKKSRSQHKNTHSHKPTTWRYR